MAKIMLVDDSETLRTQVKNELVESGHEIYEAYNGVNGLDILGENEGIELIICDVNMPEMDGLTMCKKVREQDKFKDIPIFMLTTESGADIKSKAKEIGVIGWITKPVSPSKLSSAVKKVLSMKK